MKNNNLLQASTVLFILNVSASALNYLCQLVMAKVLSVESFGTINSVFSFMMILAVPGTSLTMIVSKQFSSGEEKYPSFYLSRQLRVVVILTIIVLFSLLVLSYPLSVVLCISDVFVLIMAFVLASLGYFQPLYSGVFAGQKKFVMVGIYSLLIPIYKMVAVGGAYLYSRNDRHRLYMLLVIMVIGVVLTGVYGHIISKRMIGIDEGKPIEKNRLYSREDFETLILNISLMLYMNIDLLAVRYFCGDTESGLYSAVLLFGRIIYYFSTTLGTILLPSVAKKNLSYYQRKKTLNKTLLLMIIFSLICMLPINVLKDWLIELLYGEEYLLGAKYVVFVSIISIALSICTILINYVVGIGKTKTTTKIMCVIDILLIVSTFLLDSISSVLLVIGIIGFVGALSIYVSILRNTQHQDVLDTHI